MAIERATVYGSIGGLVQTRNIFTCDVVPQGGDTDALLWDTYLDSIYNEVANLTQPIFSTTQVELSAPSGGSWVPYDQFTFTHTGNISGDYLPNAVAVVLLGKAAGLRHVGRKFFGGIAEQITAANGLYAGGIASAAACLLAYITPFTGLGGGTITPGVVDKTGTFHPFVGGVVSSLLGSMRRRKPGLGI